MFLKNTKGNDVQTAKQRGAGRKACEDLPRENVAVLA